MKKYYLKVIIHEGLYETEVLATSFSPTTTSNSPTGFYTFWDGVVMVACYPIYRTIIYKIEEID